MKTTIQADSVTSVTVESRATGQVKVSVSYSFLGMEPSVSITPEKAQDFAEALRQAAAAAISARGRA